MAQDWFDSATTSAPAPQRQGRIVRDTYKAREEGRRDEDQQFERERLETERQRLILAQIAEDRQQEAAGRGPIPEGMEVVNGGLVPMTGFEGRLTNEDRGKLQSQLGGATGLVGRIQEIEQRFQKDFSSSGIPGLKEYLPGTARPANQEFNDAGRALMGDLAAAFGLTAQQQNTPAELEIRFGPFIPRATDRDEVIASKIARLKEIARAQAGQAARRLGVDAEPILAPIGGSSAESPPPAPPPTGQGEVRGDGRMGSDPALAGANSRVSSMIREGRPEAEIRAYLNSLRPGMGDQVTGIKESLELRRRDRNYDPAVNLEQVWQPATGVDAAIGWVADSPVGAGIISAANALTAGNLGNIAGGEASAVIDGIRDQRPLASFVGDVGGSALAMGGIGGAAGRFGLTGLTRAGGIGGDMLYGGARGFSESDGDIGDRTLGGLLGLGAAGAGSLAGQYLVAPAARTLANTRAGRATVDIAANSGRAVQNAVRGIRGREPIPYEGAGIPAPLSPSQNVIQRNMPDDESAILSALTQGRDAGMPTVLADASPQLRNLAGAAFRRSNLDTQAEIAQALTDRNLGQVGRLESQVEGALGPLQNPNRVREDITQQARDAAGPLYDQAYAQPPISTPELESLLNTPFARQAIQRARTIAANERVDPTAMGFALDDAGNAVLNPAPVQQMDAMQAAREGWDAASSRLQAATAKRDAALTPSQFAGEVRAAEADLTKAVEALETARRGMALAPSGGNVTPTPGFTTRSLDYAKRGMDDVLEQYRNPITNRLVLDEAGQAENRVLRQFLGEVDSLNPSYGEARAAYAGPASIRTAMGQGQDVYNTAPRDIADILARQNPGEQDAYRLGARVSVMDRARTASDTQNPWERVYGRLDDRERLANTFGQDAIEPLDKAFQIERAMEATRQNLTGGSPTQARQALDEQLSNNVGEGLVNAAIDTTLTGAPVRAGIGIAQRLLGDRASLGFAGARENTASEIARLLATERPSDELSLLLRQSAAYRRYVDDLRAGFGGVGAAASSGGLATQY